MDGLLAKTFTFDATNMLSKVTDVTNGEATYYYNGFGKRVAVNNPEEQIEYLLDLTKDYHNMLERSVNGETESYVYDSNVVSMSKAGNDYFYMLDELGTGMYLTGTDGAATSVYAYDEFGRNINPITGKKEKIAYTKQDNIIQPLAFTGYQHDVMTDSYFAQARYYNANAGRFVSEDKVRGYFNRPDSINHYLYCWNRPTSLRDLDGRDVIDDEFYGYQEHIDGTAKDIETAGKSAMNYLIEIKNNDHRIYIKGVSGGIEGCENSNIGIQKVIDPINFLFDPLHAVGYQYVIGCGGGIGSTANASAYMGYIKAKNIKQTEGVGSELGANGGESTVVGGGLWESGEFDEEENKYGYYGSLGLGLGSGAEAHVTITYTSETFYPLEYAYNCVISMLEGESTECIQEKQKL